MNPQPPSRGLTPSEAEEYLLSLELFGMRFGLDRMHRLMTVLGLPQRRFASIHVVGSNGKSSTVRFCAAILERHGLRSGSYTSPHLGSFRERIEVGEEPVSEADFAGAVTRAAEAAVLVNRTAGADDHVTQFEALTAAAYHELARSGVEVAVIEAGLGGRFDATNVIPSKVQVLTSVGLEHTRWLGPTLEDIAAEKLAVVRNHGTLVVGELEPAIHAIAADVAAARHADLVTAAPVDITLRAAGQFQHANFGLARAAAEAFLGRDLDDRALRAAASETVVPGRLQPVGERPLTLFDGAHNPSGAHALAVSLPDVLGERRPRVAVIGVLEDKDAAGMLEALLPHFDQAVFTRPSNPRSLSPATLVSLAEKLGGPAAETVAGPGAAVARARELAGPGGAVLATGSIYLIADLVRDDPDRPRVDALVQRVSAVLFDLDGVLVESREATERVWLQWAADNGIDAETLRAAMHGVRSADVIRELCPELDPDAESEAIERRQTEDVEGLRAIAGAAEALGVLRADRVAVVTSGTRPLALARLGAVGLEPPAVVVFAGDVSRGKPDPEGYLTAARRLGMAPEETVVVEDAPAGIEAGRAAGAATIGVTSTHEASELSAADFVIETLESLPGLLARDFDAASVLRANDGH